MRKIRTGVLAAIAAMGPAVATAQENPDPANSDPANPNQGNSAAVSSDPVAQYEQVLRQTDGLVVYNDLVARQLQAQQRELADLQEAIQQVPTLERQVPALLTRIVDGLEEFIRLDVPFYPQERAEGLAELRGIIERADVTDADKVRRILEAWQIEVEYGTSFTTYVGQLEIDGNTREVDFLQVGRIALLYQTTDEEAVTGAWDHAANAWVPLGTEHRNSVRQALRMARNQIAPEMVLLPVSAPEQ